MNFKRTVNPHTTHTHSRQFIMSHIAFLLTFKSFFKLRFIYTIKIHRNDEQNHEKKNAKSEYLAWLKG